MKTTLILLFLALASCSKNNDIPQTPQDQLPPVTTIGANTAGCIINGEVLIPKNGTSSFAGPAFGLICSVGNNFSNILFDDYFALKIINKKDLGGDFLYLHLPTLVNGVDTYTIGQSNNQLGIDSPDNPHAIINLYDGVNLGKTFLSGSNAGVITITRFNFPIVSGIFSLSAYNKDNPSEIIQVIDGRFDINITTLNQ